MGAINGVFCAIFHTFRHIWGEGVVFRHFFHHHILWAINFTKHQQIAPFFTQFDIYGGKEGFYGLILATFGGYGLNQVIWFPNHRISPFITYYYHIITSIRIEILSKSTTTTTTP